MNSAVFDGQIAPLQPKGTAEGAGAGPRGGSGKGSLLRRLLVFAGPGYLVAVGYMDPGNWATSLSAGSQFGYSLLWVILLSNVMAMLLQAAAVRLGVASGSDLAQACRRHFPPAVNFALWLLCEVAIVACNVAEVLGMACGLVMLLHIPLPVGVVITVLDVMLVLRLQQRGAHYLELLIIGLVALIGACLAAQLWMLNAPLGALTHGIVPSAQVLRHPEMLYLTLGIVGATVMPHNLYLHSSIVQTRRHDGSEAGIRRAVRYATVDSNLALGMALSVNIAILLLAALAFHRPGQPAVLEFQDAYRLLAPMLGPAASAIFGIGLIASGLSSSITGTLAGQIVMEGFLDLRISRARRAVLTRGLAIVPAVAVTIVFGEAGVSRLLVFSQVILGMQLPFAVVPLLWFTTRARHLGVHAFKFSSAAILWGIALLLVTINVWGLWETVR